MENVLVVFSSGAVMGSHIGPMSGIFRIQAAGFPGYPAQGKSVRLGLRFPLVVRSALLATGFYRG